MGAYLTVYNCIEDNYTVHGWTRDQMSEKAEYIADEYNRDQMDDEGFDKRYDCVSIAEVKRNINGFYDELWEKEQDVTERIVQDIKKEGFQPTKNLIQSIKKLNDWNWKDNTLRDIHDDYITGKDVKPREAKIRAEIITECQRQEQLRLSFFERIPMVEMEGKEFHHFVSEHESRISDLKENAEKSTLIINAYGGAGAGKTTACLDIVSELKKQGYTAEYVSEYAKDLVWEGNFDLLDGTQEHQLKILNEQLRRQDRLYGKVDFIVTDAPILLNKIYNKELTEDYDKMLRNLYDKQDNFNFVVERDTKKFETEGRIHNLEESIQKDAEVKQMLSDHGLYFGTYNHNTVNKIVDNAIRTHSKLPGINKEAFASITFEDSKETVDYFNKDDLMMKKDSLEIKEQPEKAERDDLSLEQIEYFKNSQARDGDGRLMMLYHGSGTRVTSFSPEYTGQGNDQYGSGFYFTTDFSTAQRYAKAHMSGDNGELLEKPGGEDNPSVLSVFIKVENPLLIDGTKELSLSNVFVTKEQAYEILKCLPSLYHSVADGFNPMADYFEDIWSAELTHREDYEPYIKQLAYTFFEDADLVKLENMFIDYPIKWREALRDVLGYDGVIVNFQDSQHVIAWFPEQIKDINNRIPQHTPDLMDRDVESVQFEDSITLEDEMNKDENPASFSKEQTFALNRAVRDNITGEKLALIENVKFSLSQMEEIRMAFSLDGLTLDQVKIFADPNMDSNTMDLYRYGLKYGLAEKDISAVVQEGKTWSESRSMVEELCIKANKGIEQSADFYDEETQERRDEDKVNALSNNIKEGSKVNYKINLQKTNFTAKEGSKATMVAKANIVFNEQFSVNGFKVFQNNTDKDKISIAPPQYQAKDSTYKPFVNLSEYMRDSILEDITECVKSGNFDEPIVRGSEEAAPIKITTYVTPYETPTTPKLKGLVNMKLGENDEITGITCRIWEKENPGEGQDPLMVKMPQQTIQTKGETKYVEVCHPITAELRNRLNETVLSSYRDKIGESEKSFTPDQAAINSERAEKESQEQYDNVPQITKAEIEEAYDVMEG